ncbi:MAG: histidinol dehydrogenase [Bacteroidota bacterium]
MIENIFIEPTRDKFKAICQRPKKDEKDLESIVSSVFDRVKKEGDKALLDFTEKFDGVSLATVEVSAEDGKNAESAISDSLKLAIGVAKENIEKFHRAQLTSVVDIETMNGVRCQQKSVGIERVGIYIPGGTAPLFSTVLMLAIPAQLAGCQEIVLCSPPDKKGSIHPAIIYTARLCGVDKIYKVGGAQAIAALTLGTETIPSVNKVFGPGNQYVTAAKQFAQKYGVGMDMPAGPSELLVFANETGVPEFIAADLLSQAEHGIDSQVILLATNQTLANEVNNALMNQLEDLPRKDIAREALKNSKTIVITDPNLAFDFINEYGPEHLILACEDYESYIPEITNAGSVFLGNYCPESAGDYASGTNHTLPTDGWAKCYNGVNVDSFSRKITFQEISKQGIQNIGKTVMEMANNEMLVAHAKAVEIRLNVLNTEENG